MDAQTKTKNSTSNLLPVNPLVENVPVITPEAEIEEKADMLTEIDSIATITKHLLSARREKIQLEVSNKELDEAKKIIDAMSQLSDVLKDQAVIDKIRKSIKTPKDVKELAVAYGIFADKLQALLGPNMLEDIGGRKKIKVAVAFQNSSGEQAMVQVEGDA